jgi:hypothetical protein
MSLSGGRKHPLLSLVGVMAPLVFSFSGGLFRVQILAVSRTGADATPAGEHGHDARRRAQ